MGGQAGVVATYTCNTYFDLQLELLYATHGYKDKTLIFNDERGDTMYKGYSYRIHYIDIPLLVKFFPVAGFNIQAGPQLSIGCALPIRGKGWRLFSNRQEPNWAWSPDWDTNLIPVSLSMPAIPGGSPTHSRRRECLRESPHRHLGGVSLLL